MLSTVPSVSAVNSLEDALVAHGGGRQGEGKRNGAKVLQRLELQG